MDGIVLCSEVEKRPEVRWRRIAYRKEKAARCHYAIKRVDEGRQARVAKTIK